MISSDKERLLKSHVGRRRLTPVLPCRQGGASTAPVAKKQMLNLHLSNVKSDADSLAKKLKC